MDHELTLVDLRQSINLFFDAAIFDERLEKTGENPCREIYSRYKNLRQKEVEASLQELVVRFPYYIQLRTYEKATVLGFQINYMLRGHEISESFDICFLYDDSGTLECVGRGGGVMAPVPSTTTPKADGGPTRNQAPLKSELSQSNPL